MILKHVHLFGILLLSLLLASFLGKFLNIDNTADKEGLEVGGSREPPMNQHTGGSSVDRLYSQSQPQPQPQQHETSLDLSVVDNNSTTSVASESFGGAFDTVLPSELNGNSIEPFIAPFVMNHREGLANSGDGRHSANASMGISGDKIPPGQEHLYVLKSQVVPPTTCPVCPSLSVETGSGGASGSGGGRLDDSSSGLSNGLGSAFTGSSSNSNSNSGGSKCPPCPACARCPEPSFECKKVPNYSIGQNGSMSVPRPVLADFSQFGM